MWILIKLTLSLIGLLFRFWGRFSDLEEKRSKNLNGVPYFLKFDSEERNKTQVITATYFGFEIDSKVIFDITEESRWDIFFKAIGFSEEFQTGDQLFDKHFYISSDNAAVKRFLRSEEIIRAEIMNLFTEGCLKIYCSRSIVWFKFSGDQALKKELIGLCNNLQEKISEALKLVRHLKSDPFEFKTLVIEGLIYSLAIYSIAGFSEFYFFEGDVHLTPFLVVRLGVIVGVGAALFLIFVIYLFMRGSSRSHRIIIESAMVLGISLPAGGFIAVSDINKNLDESEAHIVHAKVENIYMTEHRSRKRRTTYTYHMNISTQIEPDGIKIPTKIKISESLFSRLSVGSGVIIRVKEGYLHYPWFEDISPQKIE